MVALQRAETRSTMMRFNFDADALAYHDHRRVCAIDNSVKRACAPSSLDRYEILQLDHRQFALRKST